MPVPSTMVQSRYQVVVTAPGDVTPAALAAIAEGLSRPVPDVAGAILRAPCVLVDDLDAETASALERLLLGLGLEAGVTPHADSVEPPVPLDVAVRVLDVACLAEITNGLAAFLGTTPQQAFALLATPPGLVLGGVGEAAVASLARRLGAGAEVIAAPRDAGPFDLHLASAASLPGWVHSRLGITSASRREGVFSLGLSHDEARGLWASLGRSAGVQLVNRALLRWDLVLTAEAPTDRRHDTATLDWLSRRFGIPEPLAPRVLAQAPLALAEGWEAADAEQARDEASRMGLAVTLEAAGFSRAGVALVAIGEEAALRPVLARHALSVPARLPAVLASDLADLEARVLAHELAQAGCRTRFIEAASPQEAEDDQR
ncbi:hypothetical protein [Halomonas alimentaria]|uniref:Uncharacterized protein n=1 Tax=Halomonas alimentaria TaxID=147248 RepID=A0A7X5AR83_9GAMM|nr:hypothetical protein [Halomonas alimentaria]NAW35733.1 hypothetical protein [Halomonas alimentaria]